MSDSLRHILAAKTAESAQLHAVFAWLGDFDGRYFGSSTLRDRFAWFEAPAVYGAFDGGVPCSVTYFFTVFWRDVRERVAEQVRPAFHSRVWLDGVREDLDGVRQMRGEVEVCRRRHQCAQDMQSRGLAFEVKNLEALSGFSMRKGRVSSAVNSSRSMNSALVVAPDRAASGRHHRLLWVKNNESARDDRPADALAAPAP